MAHLKGFVHNAKEPGETLIQRITVEKILQGIPPQIREEVSQRCARVGSSTQGRFFLASQFHVYLQHQTFFSLRPACLSGEPHGEKTVRRATRRHICNDIKE